MDFETLKKYCLNKKGAYADFPFGPETLVIKTGSKLFALFGIDENPVRVNLKGDPFLNEDLRQQYSAIIPGYHMNKLHWNTVILDNSVPDYIIFQMVDESFHLVYTKLKKNEKLEIEKIVAGKNEKSD